MQEEKLEDFFKRAKNDFDYHEPLIGHQERFLAKLERQHSVIILDDKKKSWWKPLSIAASVAILLSIGIGFYSSQDATDNNQVAEMSSEVSNTQFYFASLIEEQVKQLESESIPETKKMVDDTMVQLKKLEADYTILEKDLANGGNSKMILSAMITNFQTRIDLLNDVLEQIETIKNLKEYNDENFTI
ncbi:hypothetical protein [Maribacter halichondriae]|uniref:hypothetical protein n=1 Tax=Maribacter halichondriae TaxID=2980554 RepID=UPI00235992DF|nr:hypothetical protein [Maribacter sp. Hal144]